MLTSPITRFCVDAVRYTVGAFPRIFFLGLFFRASYFCLRRVRALYMTDILGQFIFVVLVFKKLLRPTMSSYAVVTSKCVK